MAAFGRQLRQIRADLKNRPDMGVRQTEPPNPARAIMQIILSLLIVGVGLFMLVKGGYSEGAQKIIAGFMGTVLGYWLH